VRAELSSRLGWQHASARDFRWRCARTHAFLRRASILAVGSSPQLHVYIGCGHRGPVAAERGTRRRRCYHRAHKYTWRLALAETAQRDRRRCAARRCGHRGEPWPSKAMLRHGGFSRPRGGLATPFGGGAGRRRGRARRKNARAPHALRVGSTCKYAPRRFAHYSNCRDGVPLRAAAVRTLDTVRLRCRRSRGRHICALPTRVSSRPEVAVKARALSRY
jgi:hypothetical protein